MSYGEGYNGNPFLKKAGVTTEWDLEKIEEFKKCALDPIYFAEKYIKIVHVDHGFIPIQLYDYQKEIIETAAKHRFVTVATGRQQGKCLNFDTIVTIKDHNVNSEYDIAIGKLFEES